jgi:hypothetical protein
MLAALTIYCSAQEQVGSTAPNPVYAPDDVGSVFETKALDRLMGDIKKKLPVSINALEDEAKDLERKLISKRSVIFKAATAVYGREPRRCQVRSC